MRVKPLMKGRAIARIAERLEENFQPTLTASAVMSHPDYRGFDWNLRQEEFWAQGWWVTLPEGGGKPTVKPWWPKDQAQAAVLGV